MAPAAVDLPDDHDPGPLAVEGGAGLFLRPHGPNVDAQPTEVPGARDLDLGLHQVVVLGVVDSLEQARESLTHLFAGRAGQPAPVGTDDGRGRQVGHHVRVAQAMCRKQPAVQPVEWEEVPVLAAHPRACSHGRRPWVIVRRSRALDKTIAAGAESRARRPLDP